MLNINITATRGLREHVVRLSVTFE